ncbi:extracellular catalytic domain type 1 short-chain-length polyhydroxyalkanoate depolymerase [Chengkuizengella axinellae]|uniref:PHB depolymerase family esterase n=1 Tax=Chengkuizengella axinellae TaxID=3064388 RepID=A0ABT9J2G9_9BACL|nr:PHB depolymerase family esterase [Chengkuizengella sp. 2205SS18-9]MDP5275627.1 PHB depolymerase family esterase [Chengkuizengella sp. 2205SS18-9]
MKKVLSIILTLSLCFMTFGLLPQTSYAEGSFISGSHGGKSYKLYIPDGYDASNTYPLMVMIHGCTQDADILAEDTQMNALADEQGFLVLYPEQDAGSNSNKCWNWFEPSHQSRGSGEPAVIAGMVNMVQDNYSINSEKIYAAGISAGAAMTVIMGATYPDLFAGIGVSAGLEYKAATNVFSGLSAMTNGGPDPEQQGEVAYNEMGSAAQTVKVMVFHGTSDTSVYPINADQIISQWATTNDLAHNGQKDGWIDDTADETINGQVPGGRSYTVTKYHNLDGVSLMEKYIVDGMAHAWSGGSPNGSANVDPDGPDSSRIMWEFFNGMDDPAPDTEPPITVASSDSGTYNSSIQVELTTNEEATTYYTIDGSEPSTGSLVYTDPITISETTTLKYFSVDLAGNTENTQEKSYTIDPNNTDTEPPITTANPSGGTYTSSIQVELTINEEATTYYTLDGSEPTSGSTVYTEPIPISVNTTLKFFSEDVAGNVESVNEEVYVIDEVPSSSLVFDAKTNEIGYAGKVLTDGTGSNIKVGTRGGLSLDSYRGILSFDTSSLSSGDDIESVTLRLYRKSLTGDISSLSLDIREGTLGYFASLELVDYSSLPDSYNIASFSAPSEDTEFVDITIPSSQFHNINKIGRTQLRIKASTNATFDPNIIEFYGSEVDDYIPQLFIELK